MWVLPKREDNIVEETAYAVVRELTVMGLRVPRFLTEAIPIPGAWVKSR